jgi:hypothetical protein
MKIEPAAALAAWAVGSIWMVTYVFTHYANRRLGLNEDVTHLIWIISGVAGVALFPVFRKRFGAWLNKSRGK